VDRESVVFLVLGILSLSLGLGVLIVFRRTTNWDITLREVAGIPGMFLFTGAMVASMAIGARFVALGFVVCLFASLVVGTILWFKGETAYDRMQKMNKNREPES